MSVPDAPLAIEVSDEHFMAWMRGNLARAAGHFEVVLAGTPVFGWRLRSISAPVEARAGGQRCWLRVVSEYPQWAHGDTWTGNVDGGKLAGLAKPVVLAFTEWEDGGRQQRGELMTRCPGDAVSRTDLLRNDVYLSAQWWEELRRNLRRLSRAPTNRRHTTQDSVSRRAQSALGLDLRIGSWETVHGDLHWANVLAPELHILDWELWGRGPAGTDVASLYCHSLRVPAMAQRVHATFANILDSADGRVAQLAVISRMLLRVHRGDYPEMEQPLREHAATILTSA
jgi:hypothetical protein